MRQHGLLIVSGADSAYFPLLRDTVLSVRAQRPDAAIAILEHLGRHLGVEPPLDGLPDEAMAQRQRLDQIVQADDDSRTTRAECTRNGAGLVGHAHSEPATFSMRTYMRRMGWSCGQQGGCAKCQTRSSSVTCSSRPPTNTL